MLGETAELNGWYVEAGYDLMSSNETQSLTPFVRKEQYDLGEGDTVNVNVVGLAYNPQMNVTYKFDLQQITSETGSADSDNMEFTIGWTF